MWLWSVACAVGREHWHDVGNGESCLSDTVMVRGNGFFHYPIDIHTIAQPAVEIRDGEVEWRRPVDCRKRRNDFCLLDLQRFAIEIVRRRE